WNCGSGAGAVSGSAQKTCTYSSNGNYTVQVSVNDGSTVASASGTVSVSDIPQSGPLVVGVQGPSSGSIASPLNFTASASGGTASYSYAWNCQWNSAAPSSGFVAGLSTQTCSYPSAGNFLVAARITDSAGATAYSTGLPVLVSSGGTVPLTVGVQGPSTGS